MTWLDLPPDSLFGDSQPAIRRVSAAQQCRDPGIRVRIGDSVLDLARVLADPVFGEPALNAFMAQGRSRWVG